ncbi:MAG: ABC transporter permease subunit [Planctomycetes bacterium]|nr:ABC transporter permease subunit [Planctomycetota bacterium]
MLITHSRGVSNALLPRPGAVLARLLSLVTDWNLGLDLLVTLRSAVTGLLVGFGMGFILGLCSGVLHWLDRMLSPSLHFLRSIPSVAYYPLIILYLGFGETGRVVLVAVPVFLLTFVSCVTAVLSVNRHRRAYLSGLGASRWQIFRLLLVWEAMPAAVNALRLAVSLSLVLVVFGEMTIGGSSGIGARLRDAREVYALEDVFAIILVLGVIGWLANRAISTLEERLQVAWGR